MQSYSKVESKCIRIPFPSIDAKTKRLYTASQNSLDFARKTYSKPSLPEVRKKNTSISSQSTSSKDTQSNSEKSLSGEDSLSEISRQNITPVNYTSRQKTAQSTTSIESKHSYKKSYAKPIFQDVCSLQEISVIQEPVKKATIPQISAKCWAIMDGNTGEIIYSKMEKKKRQVASLTKMMNLLCVCKLMQKFGIDPKETYIEVTSYAASMRGTSAYLRTGDVATIWDILHGLMLPSGNDAAMALAENFGSYIYFNSDEYKAKCEKDPEAIDQQPRNRTKYFMRYMNQVAADLKLSNTYYANPHGLVNENSYSTATDQAKLTYHLLKWGMAREIVNQRVYTCEIEQVNGTKRKATWENTNKLLGKEGWYGTKTGITTAAGPCLSAYYENNGESYIVVLLCSMSMDIRWVEAPKLVKWASESRCD